jgi:hypothetical protein
MYVRIHAAGDHITATGIDRAPPFQPPPHRGNLLTIDGDIRHKDAAVDHRSPAHYQVNHT